jgi:3-oxoacid CoA-transferase A subunit
MAYAADLKSAVPHGACGFDPHPGHAKALQDNRNPTPTMTQKNKIYPSVDAIVADIPDGASIMFGGFGGAGFPNNLIQGLARKGSKNLSVVSNNCGTGDGELGILFKNHQIRRVTAAFPGPGAIYFQEQFDAGEVELELVPQGILCERMRAYGAGIPAFFSPVGVGTDVAKGKEERVIRGKRYILEESIGADYAFIKAYRADPLGNLVFRKGARNFNPVMATAAKATLVEADEIVEVGSLDPEVIVTPFIFVDRIVAVKGLRYV